MQWLGGFTTTLVMILGACNVGGIPIPDETDTDTDDIIEVPTCGTIDATGGLIESGQGKLLVPFGAVDEAIEICITETADEPPDPYAASSAFWRFEPHGLVFSEPVQVSLPFWGSPARPALYWSNDEGGFDRIGGIAAAGLVTAEVGHFSRGFVAEPMGLVDTFTQDAPPPVDVLFIIDNSCSMYEEQTALNDAFGDLFGPLSAVDYHIGVVTTDMEPPGSPSYDPTAVGRLRVFDGHKYIEPSTPNPADIFQGLAVVGTGGSPNEKGLDAAYVAIEVRGGTDNAGFYRPDAALMLVVLSDENDYSDGLMADPTNFSGWLASKKGAAELVSFSSIVGEQVGGPGSNATCATAYEAGHDYLDVTRTVGGVEYSVCGDMHTAMSGIATLIASTAVSYPLSSLPNVDTIVVEVTEPGASPFVLAATAWAYDGNANAVVLVDYQPPTGSVITITYEEDDA